MTYFYSDTGLVIKSWCEAPEDGAIEQAKNLARLPFLRKQVCLMPDCHLGYGMPIGGVIASQGYVIPNAVGVDIGCGMCAVKTNLQLSGTDKLKKIMGEIRKVVPVGFDHQARMQDVSLLPTPHNDAIIATREYPKARTQVGTLGGGNHFIEVQKDEAGYIWIMLHSGSRNVGKQAADFHNKIAVEINERYFSSVPSEWELAFLPIDSEEGQAYLADMNYCVEFALANRSLMMTRICEQFALETQCTFEPVINLAHNYARMEHHFGKNVMVHRKGATSAKLGEVGIIPGSQGTASYIVEGLGNPESFESCSHGAGRRIGRKEAQRSLVLADEQKMLDDQGIIHSVRNTADLDEATGAYKDISVVMSEQADLVKILVKLKPLGVIKG